jgi:hypothetical protein
MNLPKFQLHFGEARNVTAQLTTAILNEVR